MVNDESSYRYWQGEAEAIWNSCDRDKDEFRSQFAEVLKQRHEEETGCYADLLNAALSEVDWYEIAESFVDELEEEEEE